MIKLIAFDLWQTLAYRDGASSATLEMLKQTDSDIPHDKFIKIFEESIQTKRWKSKFEAYENLCKNMNLETTPSNVNLLMQIRDKDEAKTKLYAHTLPMLEQILKQGYETALISNSSIWAIEQIKNRTKLLEYIDFPIFSFNVGVIKPDLKIFYELLKVSNSKPEETIMIGDKLRDDVLPPRQIGMNSILYQNYDSLKIELERYAIKI